MPIETEVSELNVGLRELERFLEIFESYAQESYNEERLNYVNGVIAMISMQSAKIEKLIEIAEKLENVLKQQEGK